MNLGSPMFDKVVAQSLLLRGANTEYHKLCGAFRTKEEANLAVSSGVLQLAVGAINLAFVGGSGLMFYSTDLNTWITAADWTEFAQSADSYIAFDGDNDFISFEAGAPNVLDWNKDWSVGGTFVDFTNMTDNKRMTIFSNGGNHILIQRGSGQDALYITGDNGATSHGANIWYNMADNRRVLFTYSATERKMRYYIGNGQGGYNLRATVNVDAGAGIGGGGGTPDGVFSIGKGNNGNIPHFHGAMDKIIVRDAKMSDVQILEYFSNVERDYSKLSFYGDLSSYINAGEDVYPNVVDSKGALTGGEFFGGSAASFKLTPTE